MNGSVQEIDQVRNQPVAVEVSEDCLRVTTRDGRIVMLPISWFPRLESATPEERADADIFGWMIHWNALDEGISSEVILLGRQGT